MVDNVSRLEWVRRTLLRQTPLSIRLDGYEGGTADVRVTTGDSVDPRDVNVYAAAERLDEETCAVNIRAWYDPVDATRSTAQYEYEDTFRVTGSCAERPPVATNMLANVFGSEKIGKPLSYKEPVDLTEYVSCYKTSVYFELSFD